MRIWNRLLGKLFPLSKANADLVVCANWAHTQVAKAMFPEARVIVMGQALAGYRTSRIIVLVGHRSPYFDMKYLSHLLTKLKQGGEVIWLAY